MPRSSDRTQAKVHRLNRIAGQLRGIAQMIAEDRYCIDILQQIQAVKAALARAEAEILRDHAASCIAEAIASGDVLVAGGYGGSAVIYSARSRRVVAVDFDSRAPLAFRESLVTADPQSNHFGARSVTVPAVVRIPRSTASSFGTPRSTSSLIRLTMKTW